VSETYLTPQETADILKIKKTTVYDMIKKGRLKATKMGKQFRILESDVRAVIGDTPPEADKQPVKINPVARYSQTDISVGLENTQAAPFASCVICGQDMLLDVLCGYVNGMLEGTSLMRSYLGSYNGLYALYQGQVNAATAHLWDSETDSYNIPFIRKLLPGENVAVFHLVRRQVGIYVAKGNPKRIFSINDFSREDVTMINREKGSGIRVLTDSLFMMNNIDTEKLSGYNRVVCSHLAASAIIMHGGADCAVGAQRTVMHTAAVDFVPIKYEDYDLVIPEKQMDNPTIHKMVEIVKSQQFRLEIEAMGGYDVSDMGKRLL
jgi:putative molybdopterin biosynthesis protein